MKGNNCIFATAPDLVWTGCLLHSPWTLRPEEACSSVTQKGASPTEAALTALWWLQHCSCWGCPGQEKLYQFVKYVTKKPKYVSRDKHSGHIQWGSLFYLKNMIQSGKHLVEEQRVSLNEHWYTFINIITLKKMFLRKRVLSCWLTQKGGTCHFLQILPR